MNRAAGDTDPINTARRGPPAAAPRSLLLLLAAALAAAPGCISPYASSGPPDARYRVTSVRICPRCLKTVGEGHVCGVTEHCPNCGADTVRGAAGHVCGLTRYCPVCRTAVGLYHRCGVTRWRPECRQEVGAGHVCGKTRFCPACGKEVEGVHAHGEEDEKAGAPPLE